MALPTPEPPRRPDGRPFVPSPVLESARAIAEALFATDGGPPPADRLDWFVADLEDFLARMGPSRRTTVLGIRALGVLMPLALRRAASIRSMPLDDRIEALERIERGPFAGAVAGIKVLLGVIFFEHPDSEEEIGFDGECLGEPSR